MVLKKLAPYLINFQLPQKYEMDTRDSKTSTWRDVVYAALKKIGRNASLEEIYSEIEGHEKAKSNMNWQAKIRQTLQMSNLFVHDSRGVWAVAA